MQRGAGCRGCTSTAEPHNASTPQHPQTRASTMPTARPPQVPGGQLQGMEAPAQNAPYSERWEGISRSSEIGDREVVPCCTHTHTLTYTRICSKRSILDGNAGAGWQSQCPGRRCWPGSPPSSTAYRLRGLRNGKNKLGWTGLGTKWQCTDRRTFPLAAAAATACGRKRGGDAHDPQKCTQLGKKRCFRDSLR